MLYNVHIIDADKYVTYKINKINKYGTYNTLVLSSQGQSKRSRSYIYKRYVSYVFVKLMIFKGELLLKGALGR